MLSASVAGWVGGENVKDRDGIDQRWWNEVRVLLVFSFAFKARSQVDTPLAVPDTGHILQSLSTMFVTQIQHPAARPQHAQTAAGAQTPPHRRLAASAASDGTGSRQAANGVEVDV